MPQTSVLASAPVAYAGLIESADGECVIRSALVDQAAGIAPGLLMLRTSGGDNAASTAPRTAIAADDDAIMLSRATSGSTQTLDTELDGVVGTGRISPPRKVTIDRTSHANQEAVTAVLTGLDENGLAVTENFSFADGGGDSFTSTNRYSFVISLVIPAQAGTAGATKVGLAADATLEGYDVLGVSVHSHKALVAPSSVNNEVYEDECQIPFMRRGAIWVACETDFFAGQRPYVRLIAGASEVYGAFRASDTDSGDCFPWSKGRFLTHGLAGGFGVLEVNL